MGASPVVHFADVEHAYGRVRSLQNFNFQIAAGETVALLGPNGAGKTTLTRILLNLTSPTKGVVEIFGAPPGSLPGKRRLGCAPQEFGFLNNVTVRETLEFVRAHYPQPGSTNEMLEKFALGPLQTRKTHQLSGGQKRCLSLACTFIGNPDLVILDEPTVGLDFEVRRQLWSEIQSVRKRGTTTLITTHYLDEAEALASRVLVIKAGRLLVAGTVDEIKKSFGAKRLRFRLKSAALLPADLLVQPDGDFHSAISDHPDHHALEILQSGAGDEMEISAISLEEAMTQILDANQ